MNRERSGKGNLKRDLWYESKFDINSLTELGFKWELQSRGGSVLALQMSAEGLKTLDSSFFSSLLFSSPLIPKKK